MPFRDLEHGIIRVLPVFCTVRQDKSTVYLLPSRMTGIGNLRSLRAADQAAPEVIAV